MDKVRSYRYLLVLLCLMTLMYSAPGRADTPLSGINFPGPGIAGHVYPGEPGQAYHFPLPKDVKTYADFGFDIIRLAFTWERLQPSLNQPFNEEYLAGIDAFVEEADKQGLLVVLDVHNYARYKGDEIGSDAVPTAAFADLWRRLAGHYSKQDHLIFGLMNEPFKQDAKTWSVMAQKGVDAIRQAGAEQKILVPGTFYSSAVRWLHKDGEYSNGEALKNIEDPKNNIIFEAHQYLDKYSTGSNDQCVSADIGVERLTTFTRWLKDNGYQGFLGEFATGQSETCQQALDNMLAYMQDNSEVWYGWSYWVADPWFENYRFNIYPPDASKYPQVEILESFVN